MSFVAHGPLVLKCIFDFQIFMPAVRLTKKFSPGFAFLSTVLFAQIVLSMITPCKLHSS